MRVDRCRAWLRLSGSCGLSVGTRRHGTCPGVSGRRLGARGQHHGAGPRVAGRSPGPAARYRLLDRIPRRAREPPWAAAMLACRFACCGRRALRRARELRERGDTPIDPQRPDVREGKWWGECGTTALPVAASMRTARSRRRWRLAAAVRRNNAIGGVPPIGMWQRAGPNLLPQQGAGVQGRVSEPPPPSPVASFALCEFLC